MANLAGIFSCQMTWPLTVTPREAWFGVTDNVLLWTERLAGVALSKAMT